eukprot:Skav201455  [mRNA]  locus=scaffold6:293603:294559:+ [translate_table: standard]
MAICLQTSPCGFARPPQQPLSELREKAGTAFRTRAAGLNDAPILKPGEKELMSQISGASERRDWPAAKSFFGAYAGSASPVYSAAMHAAWRCRMNKEGAMIYKSCRANCDYIGLPTYTAALRIFGKLRDEAMVKQIWDDALATNDLDEVFAAARISAAADAGDVQGAAETLDIMEASNVSISVFHITSAMRACWGWGDKQHKAAKYFFDLMPKLDLTLDVASFTFLIGAYSSASLQEGLFAYNAMKDLGIVPDQPFAETYIFALLQKSKDKSLLQQLRKQSTERLQAVRNALDDFKRAGVPLFGACKLADRELTNLGL